MKRILLILLACIFAFASCSETEEPLATQTTLNLEILRVSQTSAQISVTFEGDTPYYIRYMKAVRASEMANVNMEDKTQVAAFINVRSYLSDIPCTITTTGLESLEDYVCGAVAYNKENQIIGVSYITFTASAPDDAIGEEGGAGSVDVVTL